MKEKISGAIKKFAGAIIQPVTFLAIVGLVMSVSAILKMDGMPGGLKVVGNFVYNLMMNAVINQNSLIFCIGLTCALAKQKKTDAAVIGFLSFMVFLHANNAWLKLAGLLAEPGMMGLVGTGQTTILGVQVLDMGVILGILLGCMNAWIFNRFCEVKFPAVVGIYGGTRFVLFLTMLASTILAIVMPYVWSVINAGILAFGGLIENSGVAGLFMYGFLNRALIPTGMHHVLYMPFMTMSVGGTAVFEETVYEGSRIIWMAQLGQLGNITELDASVKYLMMGFSKVFAYIGIVLAFIKMAKPEKKAQTRALLFPLLIVSILAGVTEPLDFLFLFISPLLWLVHSALDGLFQVLNFVLGCRFPLMGGLVLAIPDLIAVPASLSKWYIMLVLGLVAIVVWYFVFVFMIRKFNIPTLGREEEEEISEIDLKGKEAEKTWGNRQKNIPDNVEDLVEGLGGKDNVLQVMHCATRLRVEIRDISKLDEERIKRFKNSGIIKKGNNIQIIIGMKVSEVCEEVCKVLGLEF